MSKPPIALRLIGIRVMRVVLIGCMVVMHHGPVVIIVMMVRQQIMSQQECVG